jgi:predicted phage-related endonuclease
MKMTFCAAIACEILRFTNEEDWLAARAIDITSTEVSALFDESPYLTEFELWHQKRELLPSSFNDNERIKWGKRLQNAIGEGVAEDNGWKIESADLMYFRLPGKKIGTSLDFLVQDEKRGLGILEIKNVDSWVFRDDWIAGDDIEAPNHIELQVQHQLQVTGLNWACIAALVGGNEIKLLFRERNPAIGSIILNKVDEFWSSDKAPSPIFDRDADAVRSLNKFSKAGKEIDLSQDNYLAELCRQHKEAGAQETFASKKKKALGAEIISKIGDAEKAIANGFKISAGTVKGAPVSFFREAYRGLRITELKQKEGTI